MRHPILLFDGDCNFCRATVRWILEHDPEGIVHFAPIHSEAGKRLLREHGVAPDRVESAVLLDRGQACFKSDAVFGALKFVDSKWRLARGLRVIPRPLRDLGYMIVSKNRPWISRAAGTIDHRYEPPPQLRDRFLAT